MALCSQHKQQHYKSDARESFSMDREHNIPVLVKDVWDEKKSVSKPGILPIFAPEQATANLFLGQQIYSVNIFENGVAPVIIDLEVPTNKIREALNPKNIRLNMKAGSNLGINSPFNIRQKQT